VKSLTEVSHWREFSKEFDSVFENIRERNFRPTEVDPNYMILTPSSLDQLTQETDKDQYSAYSKDLFRTQDAFEEN